jgi:hypothetical protein
VKADAVLASAIDARSVFLLIMFLFVVKEVVSLDLQWSTSLAVVLMNVKQSISEL